MVPNYIDGSLYAILFYQDAGDSLTNILKKCQTSFRCMAVNSPDIALIVDDLKGVVAFFKNVLKQEVSLLKEGTYKVSSSHYNLYLTKITEIKNFSSLMEYIVEDVESFKDVCLENDCRIVKWEKGDKWLQHSSGFMFNLDEK
jgi:hypothetical protein